MYVLSLFIPFQSVKYISDISELFIQCDTDSCCEHITGGLYISLYGCISLLAPVYALISNQSMSKKPQLVRPQ